MKSSTTNAIGKKNFLLYDRYHLGNSVSDIFIQKTDSFYQYLMLPFPVVKKTDVPAELPFSDSIYMQGAIRAQDLVSQNGQPPNLKQPLSPQVQKLYNEMNHASQIMVVYQTQSYQKNFQGHIYGGIISCMVDHVTAQFIIAAEKDQSLTSSIQLTADYVRGVRAGERLFFITKLQNLTLAEDPELEEALRKEGFDPKHSDLKFRGFDGAQKVVWTDIYDEKGRLCYICKHIKIDPGAAFDQSSGKMMKQLIGGWKSLDKYSEEIGRRYPDKEEVVEMSKSMIEAYKNVISSPKL